MFYRIVLYTCYLYYMLLCYALPHTLNMTRFQLNMSRGDDFPLGVSSASLVLLPGMLSSGVAYIFSVTVRPFTPEI